MRKAVPINLYNSNMSIKLPLTKTWQDVWYQGFKILLRWFWKVSCITDLLFFVAKLCSIPPGLPLSVFLVVNHIQSRCMWVLFPRLRINFFGAEVTWSFVVKNMDSNPSSTTYQLWEPGNSLTSLTLSFLVSQIETIILISQKRDESQINVCATWPAQCLAKNKYSINGNYGYILVEFSFSFIPQCL